MVKIEPFEEENAEHLTKPSTENTKSFLELFRGLGKVLNEVGIAGFCVISIVVFIFLFADQSHKNEIIDSWILFKSNGSQFFIIIFVLLIILLMQQIHYKRYIKLQDERIDILSKKKSSEYSEKLNQKLNSSKKRKT